MARDSDRRKQGDPRSKGSGGGHDHAGEFASEYRSQVQSDDSGTAEAARVGGSGYTHGGGFGDDQQGPGEHSPGDPSGVGKDKAGPGS